MRESPHLSASGGLRSPWFSLVVLATGLALLAACGRGQAQGEASEPNSDLKVTPQVGPWMILIHSYQGPNSAALARELCVLLRQRDRLPAYVFEHGAEERRQQEEYIQRIHQLCPEVERPRIRRTRIEEQWAVLVGGYADMETASRALRDVKRLKPPDSKRLMDIVTRGNPGAINDEVQPVAYLSPFPSSFVVPNPVAPHQAVADQRNKADRALRDLNDGRPYNLLDCRQPWTLVVMTFQGAAAIQPVSTSSSFLSMLGLGNRSADLLTAGGKQAEEVARVLRQMQFDAYVLHTRTNSLVTVGGYAGPDDGRLSQMQRQLAKLKLGPFECLPQPAPMEIPRP